MSSFKGRTVKNKSQGRREIRDIIEFNKKNKINIEGFPFQDELQIEARKLVAEQLNTKQEDGL